ncbi:hypothetical protein [Streptomyces sp. NBC_00878]|uniref:hypothetical protein n=1 Tax=Streptomyces sp. NBC_00878 TaxID=2975854 RepID=UPI002256BCBE|nr:hypothetical protein [Streptomyces sp. NBC_00878]MCX4904694.1 hypothetical protein [Streptomyces sp. NBC_00878]
MDAPSFGAERKRTPAEQGNELGFAARADRSAARPKCNSSARIVSRFDDYANRWHTLPVGDSMTVTW